MTYPSQLNAALAALAVSGLSERSYAPPLHRLAWWLGWYAPPPHLASFGMNVAFFGIFFGLALGIFMSVAVWTPQGMPLLLQIAGGVAAGILFGLTMAEVYRRRAAQTSNAAMVSLRMSAVRPDRLFDAHSQVLRRFAARLLCAGQLRR
jgi:hypothetical protein